MSAKAQKILLIDDNNTVRMVVSRILRASGYDVYEADAGDQGFRLAKEVFPDLILLDVNLPDINGMELCRQMKQDPDIGSILVVHLSSERISVENRVEGLSNADGYITWPIRNDDLLAQVRAMLRIRQAENALAEQQKWFRGTLSSIVDGVIATDTASKVTYLNAAAERLSGWSLAEALGKNLNAVLHLAGQDGKPIKHLDRHFEGESVIFTPNEHYYLTAKAGHKIPVNLSGGPIKDERGLLLGGVLAFHDISSRLQHELEREKLITELQDALTNVKTLSGLIPICANCKKIRDDKGYWEQVEHFFSEHTSAQFTHGICPDCAEKFFPDDSGSVKHPKA